MTNGYDEFSAKKKEILASQGCDKMKIKRDDIAKRLSTKKEVVKRVKFASEAGKRGVEKEIADLQMRKEEIAEVMKKSDC